MIHFSSVANDDICDTRLIGMSEEKLHHHESVHKITQSCNRRLAGDSSQFKFHLLEPKETPVALPNLNSTKSTGHDLIPAKILKRAIGHCNGKKVTGYQCLRKAINKASSYCIISVI